MMERRGNRHKHLLDKLKEKRGYWSVKEEALRITLWRTCTMQIATQNREVASLFS
jgi:hypothetical protein